jgi:hypothetical protein
MLVRPYEYTFTNISPQYYFFSFYVLSRKRKEIFWWVGSGSEQINSSASAKSREGGKTRQIFFSSSLSRVRPKTKIDLWNLDKRVILCRNADN